jgi:sugar lactone lactonase YvrE
VKIKAAIIVTCLAVSAAAQAQPASTAVNTAPAMAPTNLPDPYEMPQYLWGQTLDGKPWGSTSGIALDPQNHLWAIGRCGANTCDGSNTAPVYEIDMATGKAIKSIGAGVFVWPHGFDIDKQGNIWVTDAMVSKDGTRGEQAIKLSPDGKVLMRIGTAGKAGGGPDHLNDPSDILVAPNGDIFIADGHNGMNAGAPADYVSRIVKFSPQGKFIKEWGTLGSGEGQFKSPHALAMDSQGRLFVADRGNNRVLIYSQDGKFIADWKQFGRPVGLYIDKKDTLYVTDADSTPALHPGWPKGVWIGSARTGKVTGFVVDNNAGEGVVTDTSGTLYAAVNVPPHGITRYALPYTPPATKYSEGAANAR